VAKNQTLVHLDLGEKRLCFAVPFVAVRVELLPDDFVVHAFDVVIAPDQVEATGLVELPHLPEDVVVVPADDGEVAVFPQFVAVADLDVGETVLEVTAQGVIEEQLVVGKIVRPTVVAPVTVAEEVELRRVVEWDRILACLFEDLGQSFRGRCHV
jgi:hypothetical protein